MFQGYLTSVDHCAHCGEALHHHQADDAPPYITIFIVGHIVVGLILMVERGFTPPIWLHLALWLPLTIILSLLILRPIKGGIIGLQWAQRMHGFDPSDESHADPRPGTQPVSRP